ncbi:MAG: hypothetical protein KAQ62_00275, partial [Cyclobacteriaceae bacterium]|nr:hypothetical protein [Cyclobacteriaceae bacterium]
KVDAKKAVFSTDISGAYTESANVKKWVRSYVLERGKKFRIQDNYELIKMGEEPTTLNFVTYCKVSEIAPGTLQLKGDGFTLALKYNQKTVTPKIEFNEVTDSGLKRYWPDGITRIVLEVKNPKLKGKNEVVITKAEK